MATASLVLTLIGPNTTGIVSRVARIVADHDANWLGARMANLAGQFAGIVQIELPDSNVDAFAAALRGLEAIGMRFMVARGEAPDTLGTTDLVHLELVGQDHPGIVRDIAAALASRGVSIEQLVSDRVSGAFSGEALFKAAAQLRVPNDVPAAELRAALESVALELMVDITFDR